MPVLTWGMDQPMHQILRRSAAFASALLAVVALAGPAEAQVPTNWEMGMQAAHSPVKERIASLHDTVLIIITLVTLLVAGLLVYVLVRYNHRRNPTPSRTSHHTLVEVLWTVLPVLILVGIFIPSLRLVYYEDRTREADLTVKVTAHQWYWEYTYPDNGNVDFTSYMVPNDALKPGQLRLLDVDNPLVLPQLLRAQPGRATLCHSRAHHRDLGARRCARELLRRVQPDLRHQPQHDADLHPRRRSRGIQFLGAAGEDHVRRRPGRRVRTRPGAAPGPALNPARVQEFRR
jgi:hypothetical protein